MKVSKSGQGRSQKFVFLGGMYKFLIM